MSQARKPSRGTNFLVSENGNKRYFKHKVSAWMAYHSANGYVTLWSAAGSGWHLENSKGGSIRRETN
jgi:hypothetical protein